MVGRKKKLVFNFIKEKLKGRIAAWQGWQLPKAEKEILLNTVAQALPTFAMSLYLLPNGTCDEIHKVMNAYWFGSDAKRGGVKLMRQEKMCVSKDSGGIGFRDLKGVNRALLAK